MAKYLAVQTENYRGSPGVKVCPKQKSNVANDGTFDPAALRSMSDIVFAAESNQVCRKGREGGGSGKARSGFF